MYDIRLPQEREGVRFMESQSIGTPIMSWVGGGVKAKTHLLRSQLFLRWWGDVLVTQC